MQKQSWKYYKNNVIILFINKIITFLINKIINQYLSLSLSLSLSIYIYIYIYVWPNLSIYPFFFFFLNWMEIHCLLVAFWSAQLVEKLPRYQVTTLWIKKKKTCFQPIFKWKCFRNTPKFSFNPYLTSKQFLISQKFQNSSRLKKKNSISNLFSLARLRVKHIIWTPIIK